MRVYYEDTDAGGVVYYANYLKFWSARAPSGCAAWASSCRSLADKYGILFVVRSVAIDYLKPARLNDALAVTVELLGPWSQSDRCFAAGAARRRGARGRARPGGVRAIHETIRPAAIPQPILDRIAPLKSE